MGSDPSGWKSPEHGFERQFGVELVVEQPFLVVEFGFVFQSGVAEDGDDGQAGAVFLGMAHGGGDVDAAGEPEAESFA